MLIFISLLSGDRESPAQALRGVSEVLHLQENQKHLSSSPYQGSGTSSEAVAPQNEFASQGRSDHNILACLLEDCFCS